MNKTIQCLLSFLYLAVLANVANANHIDFIVDGSFILNADAAAFASEVQVGDGGNIIGTEREVSIGILSGGGFVSAGTVDAAMGPGAVGPDTSKTLQLSNSVTSLGRFELLYDGVGSAGLGGADFDTNWDALVVDFASVQGAGNLTLAVTDNATGVGSLTLPVSSAGMITFPFSSFPDVDFMAVDSVKFTLDTTEAASDFSIGAITREAIVPEPGCSLMAILGLACLAGFRRRARTA